MADINYYSELHSSAEYKALFKQLEQLTRTPYKVAATSLNAGIKAGLEKARELVKSRYTLNHLKVDSEIKSRRATARSLSTRIFIITQRSFHITDFSHHQVRPGLMVRVRKDEGRKLLSGAFIQQIGYKRIAFSRWEGAGRYPINAIYTVTGYEMLNWPDMHKQVTGEITEVTLSRLRVEVDRILKRRAKA